MTIAVRGAGWSAPGARAAPTASARAAMSETKPVAIPVIRMSIRRMTDDCRQPRHTTKTRRAGAASHPTAGRPAWLHVAHRLRCQHPGDERRRCVDARACRSPRSRSSSRARAAGGCRQPRRRRSAACARELGYRPNVAAQALRLGSSRAVALLGARRHQPVLRPRPARRPARGQAGRLHGGAGRHRQRPRAGRSSRSRRCAPAPSTATCSSRSMPPEGLAADEQVVLIESRARGRSSVRFDAERRRSGRLRASARARPSPHRPPRRRLRRARPSTCARTHAGAC